MTQRATSIFAMWGDVWFSPLAREAEFRIAATSEEITNFASGGMVERIPGTLEPTFRLTGWVDETVTLTKIATLTTDHWLTVAWRTPAADEYFYSMNAIVQNAQPIGGPVGGAQIMQIDFVAYSNIILRGKTLHWATTTATGAGTGVNFGAMAAADTLYHVFGVDTATIAGTTPTLAVLLERSATDVWGAPTTVYTLATATDAPANTYQTNNSVTGAQAETWYRNSYTIAGAGASFKWFAGLATTTLT